MRHPALRFGLLLALLVGPLAVASSANDAARPLTGVPPAPEGFALRGDVERGAEIFGRSCATCHGESGDGNGRMALDPPAGDLRDPARMAGRTDWEIFVVIRDGGKPYGLAPAMIGWGRSFPEDKLQDVATFVRGLAAAEPEEVPGEEAAVGNASESPDR